MELKQHMNGISHDTHLSPSLPNLLPSSIHCCRFKPWINTKISIRKHFELWRFHILQMLKPYIQNPNQHHSAHAIKRAQTLNSILRQYGVSIDLIAAGNKNTMDVDFLLKYQLLGSLTFAPAANQLIKRSNFSSVHQVGLVGSSFDRNSEEKPLRILTTTHGFPHAKSSGYFLVLVPLIAFCITCLVGAFCTRVQKDNESHAFDESRKHKGQPKSTRWKHALSYNSETDNTVSESGPEDEDENVFEDAYSKVENDYQKFLSECGISECGYQHRRGGIHQ
ncbi:uncharacterized protein [Euphorbia lathyris]|uniref:uncharacterized protein isoform X2 n=1 Tax=Euphorbia lathyris TaxID=212925 RepID=UPI0033139B98